MTQPILAIEHLSVVLPAGGDRLLAVDDLSLTISAGETLCIVGESGSGKSVLATTVLGLLGRGLKVSGGKVAVGEHTLIDGGLGIPQSQWRALRGSRIGMVFQEPTTALNPVMSCGRQIDEVLCAHTDWGRERRHARILDIFSEVRLPDPQRLYQTYPHQLSGGQRQRVVIAMAMVLKPELLICDEPTTALDVTTQAEILKLIARLQSEQGSAVLFITHDMGVVSEIAHHVLVMHEGRTVEQGAAEAVLGRPAQDYTRMLLASIPSMVPPPPRASNTRPPIVRGESVSKTYAQRGLRARTGQKPALDDVSVAIAPGETVGIVGESGSGKSTLARCLIRLIEPSGGTIWWGDAAVQTLKEPRLRLLRSRVQIVFQDPNRSLNPRRRVGKSLIEGAQNFGLDRGQAEALARELLDRVRLPQSALARYPHQFSGGQRQRLAIARALACRPALLIADEAVSALDVSVQAQILQLLRELQAEFGIALLFITHDLRVAAQLCDRVVVMQGGRVVEEGPTEALFSAPREEYTRRLLTAAPRIAFATTHSPAAASAAADVMSAAPISGAGS